jgi:hypothetical protein
VAVALSVEEDDRVLGVPKVRVRLAVKLPPPVKPLPAVIVIADLARVLSAAWVWLVVVVALVEVAVVLPGVPRVRVRLAERSPPPDNPLPAVRLIAALATVASMAWVWLVVVTALVEVAVELPGVPMVKVRSASRVPPPVNPLPAVRLIADLAMVALMAWVWLVPVISLVDVAVELPGVP